MVIPQGIAQLFVKMPEVLEDATNEFAGFAARVDAATA